jgi:predicted NACHT family NTPase
LVAERKSKYGVSKKLGQQWVKNRQLLPLLDGLDEVKLHFTNPAFGRLTNFYGESTAPSIWLSVVASKSMATPNPDYSSTEPSAYNLSLMLRLVDTSLMSIMPGLWQVISDDIELLELVRTPLLLSITILVSEEISIEQWQQLTSTFDRIQYLLSAYVRQMLTREIDSKAYIKHKPPSSRQTRLWLVWLAQQLLNESKTEFLIEEMQPNWLRNKRHVLMYRQLLG